MTHLSWVALHSNAHSFMELHKPLCHNKVMIHEGEVYFRNWHLFNSSGASVLPCPPQILFEILMDDNVYRNTPEKNKLDISGEID